MECSKCNIEVNKGEKREYNKEILCEDCYIDIITPTKFCDPWATFQAKSFIEKNPNLALNDNQLKIVKVLEKAGELEPIDLIDRLKNEIAPEEGERECAALNRMEKIAIENKNGRVFLRLK